jgi:AAA15 family ATPase/GTPase
MKNHFIKDVKFENFKCFKELEVKDLKRVNLISGKNNIGKTSFMEGLELYLSSKDSYEVALNIYKMIRRRQQNIRRERYFELDFMHANNTKMEISVDNKNLEIEYLEELPKIAENLFKEENLSMKYQPSFRIKINGDERFFPIERIMDRPMMIKRETDKKLNINFVSSTTTDEREIAIFYGKLIDLNKEDYLDKSLKLFDENILALKQKMTERDVVLKLLLNDREMPILLSSLGEGINRYIAILCAIWASKDGYLFIDEIENGIHYTNYPKLWKIIFEASKMANCQIFATSHSKECIEAFNKMNESDDCIYLEFYKNQKTGLITVKERDNEQLEYALTHNSEIRG